jgi:hypothetical protein
MPLREAWATQQGAVVRSSSWAGMYYPGASSLYLTGSEVAADTIQRCVARLDKLPAPIHVEAWSESWAGESAPYTPIFLSPARKASNRAKRARPRLPAPGEVRHGALAFGVHLKGMSWRPNAQMPIHAHREAGNLIQVIFERSHLKCGPWTRLSHIRSSLVEWLEQECLHTDHSGQELTDLYHGGYAASGLPPVAAIDRIATLLSTYYPDCVPRRDLLRCLSSVRKYLAS